MRRKGDDFDSSAIVSSKKYSVDYKPVVMKHYVLVVKCRLTTDNWKDLKING